MNLPTAMEPPGYSLIPQDLTGHVSIVDYRTRFSGIYSSVYKGTWGGQSVAIKVIQATGDETSDASVQRKMRREIALWTATTHPNIQPFYGFAYDEEFSPFGALISPWCPNGDATRYLREHSGDITVAKRVILWKGVIEGVSHLHEHQPTIVHGDLKPGNVLIDNDGSPRICDFGLARVFLEAEGTGMTTTSEHTGTTRYLAPELVDSEETVYPTTESDVYALGCLGLEFIYGQKPYANRANNLRGQIVRDIRHHIPPATTTPRQDPFCQPFWDLMEHSWRTHPQRRLAASSLLLKVKHTEIALRLSPHDASIRMEIQRVLKTSILEELSKETCLGFNATPAGPEYTCGLFDNPEEPCRSVFSRYDHVVHHLQEHLGVTPYSCAHSNYVTSMPKCNLWFSSTTARDTHVRSKDLPYCDCTIGLQPEPWALHEEHCWTHSSLPPEPDVTELLDFPRPLRLLALDGGGIRGFSELKILQAIMGQIQLEKRLAEPPHPCEYFDLIGGTSTGGIIAILLGRLRLPVDKCLEIYAGQAENVFREDGLHLVGLTSRFDCRVLENVIKQVLQELTPTLDPESFNSVGNMMNIEGGMDEMESFDANNLKMPDNHPHPCRAFVTATSVRDAKLGFPRLFRTYRNRSGISQIDCKIWEALRATCAAPSFFDPIVIGDERFVDGGLGCRNPVNSVYEEARELWPGREIGYIISLGTGIPPVLSLQNPSLLDTRFPTAFVQTLSRTATDCETAHQDMMQKKELLGKYFRFNVRKGLEYVGLTDWQLLGETALQTGEYLREFDVRLRMNEVVAKMVELDDWL